MTHAKDMVALDARGNMIFFLFKPQFGHRGVYVFHRPEPTKAKWYILTDFDIDPDWPPEIRQHLREPTGIGFEDMLAMRASEHEYASILGKYSPDLVCRMDDEVLAAKRLGMDLARELGIFANIKPFA